MHKLSQNTALLSLGGFRIDTMFVGSALRIIEDIAIIPFLLYLSHPVNGGYGFAETFPLCVAGDCPPELC